jgi:competence protein ComEC
VAGALAAGRPAPPDPRALVVWFLDVGQGDATLIQHGGASMLVDTGPPDGPLLGRLRAAGLRRLDVLVVTHAQSDHEGMAAAVLDHYPVGLLVDGADGAATGEHRAVVSAARRHHVRRTAPDAGQEFRVGPLRLEVLWPHREPPERHADEDPNLRAVVAVLHDGDFDLLLPADAESDVTAGLDLAPVEAVKVAHHGSRDPGLPDLLARLRPRLAVVEVGRHNPYGHPTAQALAALRGVPAVYRTDRDGTVRLSLRQGRMAIARDP